MLSSCGIITKKLKGNIIKMNYLKGSEWNQNYTRMINNIVKTKRKQ